MDVSKIFTRKPLLPARIEVPGTTDEDREQARALRAAADRSVAQRRGFLLAMIGSGKPVYGGTVSPHVKRARRAEGKRQRRARRVHRATT